MITIKNRADGLFFEGHADYAENGKDIVCAGVSSLYYALISMPGVSVVDKGEMREVLCRGPYKQMALAGLRLLEATYPKNIKIIKENR